LNAKRPADARREEGPGRTSSKRSARYGRPILCWVIVGGILAGLWAVRKGKPDAATPLFAPDDAFIAAYLAEVNAGRES